MKSNQSIHISIQEPPNPKPVKTVGILTDPDNPNIHQLIQLFLSGIVFDPKDNEFRENVKDEALKLLSSHNIIGVAKRGNLISVVFENNQS